MLTGFNFDNFKIIIQNFSVKDDILYWYDKAVVAKNSNNDIDNGTNYFAGGPTVRVVDGGTGATSITGLVKGNGTTPFTSAVVGVDYVAPESAEALKNKTIDASENNIRNLNILNFIDGFISNDELLSENSSFKLATQAAIKNYVEFLINKQSLGQLIKEPVSAASVENIDINNVKDFDVIDGVILRVGDRILLKNQIFKNTNGIYEVQSDGVLKRTSDANVSTKLIKASVFVKKGSKNKGTTWYCNNKSITEWISNINWQLISEYPVYSEGYGILIDNIHNIISLDASKILHTNMTEPIKTELGGTGNKTFITNSLIASGNTEQSPLTTVPKGNENQVLLSGDTNSLPRWSDFKYSDNLQNKSILFYDNKEIQTINISPGICTVNALNNIEFTKNLPNDITINNNTIYYKNGEKISIFDGGTGKSNISKNHILYGYENDEYKETFISTFGRNLISHNNADELKTTLSLKQGAFLNIGNTDNTLAIGNHSHDEYTRVDGTRPFTSPVSGIQPTISDHLATKGYVDAVSVGQLWQDPVNSIITEYPTELFIGDRFLISKDVTNPVLIPYKDNIVTISDHLGTKVYTPPQRYYVIKDLSTGLGWIYNGTKWIFYSNNEPHNALSNLQGGSDGNYYHLSKTLFTELTGQGITHTHKHLHNEALGLQGGDGINYYHLTATEYAQVSNTNFKYHNRLFGLQGGKSIVNEEEFYHLNSDQHNQLVNNNITNIHRHKHNNLTDIKGSTVGYHLSENNYSELVLGNTTNIHKHKHNNLTDLQGGNATERYHLDSSQYEYLINISNILKTKHNEMNSKQGGSVDLNQFFHLDYLQYMDITQNNSAQYHHHAEYINKDGSVNFINSPEIPLPIKDTHIANKGYVDSLITGLKWKKSVKSKNYSRPPVHVYTVQIGDRFIVNPAGINEWINLSNKIVEWNGSEWEVIPSEVGTAVYVEDNNYQWVWNGTDWVMFTTKQDHNNLANLLGGKNQEYYHLKDIEHNKLTANGPCDIHYHPDAFNHAIGPLSVLKGGTGLVSIPSFTFLYARTENKLEPSYMSIFSKNILELRTPDAYTNALGLKNMSLQKKDDVDITGGSITGINPISAVCGGTGLNYIAENKIIYTTSENTFTTADINVEGLNILNFNKSEQQSYLGINDPKNIQDIPNNSKSKLFYLVTFGF